MVKIKKINIGRLLFLMLSILWYFIIFLMTSNANFSHIGTFKAVESTITPIFKEKNKSIINYEIIKTLNAIVRVMAHCFIFFVQAIFILHFLALLQIDKDYLVYFTLLFVSLLGLLDEFHQSFVPNRQFRYIDVLKDDIGAVAAIMVFWFTEKRNFIIKYFTN